MYKLKSHFPKFSKPLKHLLGKKQMLWSSLLGCHLTIHVTLDQIVHIADPLLWIWDLKQWSELYFLPSAPEDTKVINFVNTKHRIYYAICFIFNFTVIYYYIFIKNLISFQQERHNTYCVKDGLQVSKDNYPNFIMCSWKSKFIIEHWLDKWKQNPSSILTLTGITTGQALSSLYPIFPMFKE